MLIGSQAADTAFVAKPGQARDPTVLEQPVPDPDGVVVVEEENSADFLAVHATVKQHNRK